MISSINILYIDDNLHDQELVLDALVNENKGFVVSLVSSQEEFEYNLKQRKHDLVLSDLNILGYEGLSVLDTVNNFDPAIPVIIVTGTGSEEIAVEAMKRGAAEYVIKSTSHIRRLPLIIKGVIEKRNLQLLNLKAQDELIKLRKAVENSGEIIFTTDKDGMFTFVNPEFTKVYGYSFEEVVGKATPRILKSNGSDEEIYNDLWTKLLNGQNIKGEFINRTKDGVLLTIEFSINPGFDKDNRVNNFLAIQRDITGRKRAEEQLQKQYIELQIAKEEAEKADKLKTEFLAQVSHEIRTPLNTILNFTSFIKNEAYDKVGDDTKYSFEAIENASHRLIRTIDLILNMSELQTESYHPFFRDIDLNSIIYQQTIDFSFAAKKKGLNIVTKKITDDNRIFGDEYAVTHILQNLLDNAIKYTDTGYIEIKIDGSDNNVFIEISDTGIGISEEFIPKLFTPFSQEYSGYSRLYDGNGLGLAIVKKYIEMNRGQIEINSTKGKGTTVKVTFNKSSICLG